MLRQKPLSYLMLWVSLMAYAAMAYGVPRHETALLFALYFLLFAIYLWVLKTASGNEVKFWIAASVLWRLSMLLATPALSDDVYRFIWDGRLLANGYHPFAELPGYYLQKGFDIPGIGQSLYSQLNSPHYFSIYPPFAQYIFWASAVVSPQSALGSMVVMRVFIIAAEVGGIFLLQALLERFNASKKNTLIYALNPLVVIELTGNLHFEAFVVFFLLLALYLLVHAKVWQAGVAFAFSIASKLLPAIFLPLFLIRLGLKRSLIFYGLVLMATGLLSFPLLDGGALPGLGESFALYFKKFEFNASIYYLVREYGFWAYGYNIIQTAGWKLGLVSTIFILVVSFWPIRPVDKGRALSDVPLTMMWALLAYFLFTTTLHPWYIAPLLMLSVFTKYRFVVVWTAMVFLTYAGYTATGFSENLYLVLLEYVVVIGYLVYEWIWKKARPSFCF